MKLVPILLAVAGSGCLLFTLRAENPVTQKTVVPGGAAGVGKKLFVERGCYKCHTVKDTELPQIEVDPTYSIALGVEDQAEWTRDDFARAIMNPNHTVNPEYHVLMITLGDHLKAENSPMPTFNDLLTVTDLINISTFLSELPK